MFGVGILIERGYGVYSWYRSGWRKEEVKNFSWICMEMDFYDSILCNAEVLKNLYKYFIEDLVFEFLLFS